MENALTYLILIVIGLLVFAVYKIRHAHARPHLLSQQIYPEVMLKVLVRKEKNKTSHIQIEIYGRQSIHINDIKVELIMQDRQMHSLPVKQMFSPALSEFNLEVAQHQVLSCPFNDFKDELMSVKIPFKTFRVVAHGANAKKFKSNELAFNNKWVIYKPDSGTYN